MRSIIWSLCVPPKVSFFAWKASWGKTLTLNQVERRGWSLENKCFLCHIEEETINYILLHCVKARVLWQLLFALFGMSWVLSLMVRETLLSFGMAPLWASSTKKHRRQPLYVSSGWSRKKEIDLLLITRSFQSKGWKTLLFVLYSLGKICI